MKINPFKKIILLCFFASFSISCVSEDDYVIPTVLDYAFNESFSQAAVGSSPSIELPIALNGWVNHNATATRLWSGKSFSGNVYAEFSSFFSAAGTNDEAWLITPGIDLSAITTPVFSFTSKTRFANGAPLKILVSTNYDGTIPGIATATWTEVSATFPTQNDVFISSGNIDLTAFKTANTRIAFKYTGSKTTGGITTTMQIDNVKVLKN